MLRALELKVPPLLLVALCAVAIYGASDQALPQYLWQWMGLCTGIGLAMAIVLNAFYCFYQQKTTVHPYQFEQVNALVQSGIYRFSRNPMYLAMAISLLAMTLGWPSVWAALVVVFFVVYLTYFQIKPEERLLASRFQQPYLDYCQRVRRWI
ncbi:hypothetical protein VST7929_03071 [Vibrio stylophorae]|uniref:Isoprenylcysteine carboxylmethyltransferase family protein n=1 Tax=Vibrio stylophorae TaxID=659351 RepID=A0ABN8DZ02_9VIBR|nr:isoprenylcysteine carboxylmethyltransferase family protein [Vibrio stylophorae]CAH0535501.1 hypothetical protein VST7929_03071 [Vibrio stylophorae]